MIQQDEKIPGDSCSLLRQ